MNHTEQIASAKEDKPTCILIGAGGHAKVLLALLRLQGWNILGACCPLLAKRGETHWRGHSLLGAEDAILEFNPETTHLINGVGMRVDSDARHRVYERFKHLGYHFPAIVHPRAFVDEDVILKEGVQVMAGAIIQPDAIIGENTIINSRASVDHDCLIGANVHIAPGAVLCGQVRVGHGTFIGCGSAIAQGLSLGENVIVGAGVSVVRDIQAGTRVIPAAVRTQVFSSI